MPEIPIKFAANLKKVGCSHMVTVPAAIVKLLEKGKEYTFTITKEVFKDVPNDEETGKDSNGSGGKPEDEAAHVPHSGTDWVKP